MSRPTPTIAVASLVWLAAVVFLTWKSGGPHRWTTAEAVLAGLTVVAMLAIGALSGTRSRN